MAEVLSGPAYIPGEAVVLCLGGGDGVDHVALRELTLAAVGVIACRRWLLTAADPWLAEFVWEAAGLIGVRRHIRFLRATPGIPAAVRLRPEQLESIPQPIVAHVIGGSPASLEFRARSLLPFGSTGGTAAELARKLPDTGRKHALMHDTVYAPLLVELLDGGKGVGGPPWAPRTPPEPMGGMLSDYAAEYVPLKSSRARALMAYLQPTADMQSTPTSTHSIERLCCELKAALAGMPLVMGVFGTAAHDLREARDVDLIVLVPPGSQRLRLGGFGLDVTVVPCDAFEQALKVGDLFAWSVATSARILHDPERRTARWATAAAPPRPALESQVEMARQVGWLLCRPEARLLQRSLWKRRARWVARTLCSAVAVWHGATQLGRLELGAWLGGHDAALLLHGDVGRCGLAQAQRALQRCLAGTGPAPSWFGNESSLPTDATLAGGHARRVANALRTRSLSVGAQPPKFTPSLE